MRNFIDIVESWKYPEDRSPSLRDWDRILTTQRELEGLKAAIRDPKTDQIYVAWTHQAAIEKVPHTDDTGAYGRLQMEWDEATDNVGFITKSGEFITRNDAFKKWGIFTIEDAKDILRKR